MEYYLLLGWNLIFFTRYMNALSVNFKILQFQMMIALEVVDIVVNKGLIG